MDSEMGLLFMVIIACTFIVMIGGWATKPLKPATIVRVQPKLPTCVDCNQQFTDVYFTVLRCDKCLLTYINRMDEGELEADGALSVKELERMWAL